MGLSCFSKMAARATVAPVAIYFGNYIASFWLIFFVCLVSLLVSAAYVVLSRKFEACESTPKLSMTMPNSSEDAPLDGFALSGGLSLSSPPEAPTESSALLGGGGGGDRNRYASAADAGAGARGAKEYSPISTPGTPDLNSERKSKIRRIESLISIRSILSLGGINGLGWRKGPVVVAPEGAEGPLDLSSDVAKVSKDPLIQLKREISLEQRAEVEKRREVSFCFDHSLPSFKASENSKEMKSSEERPTTFLECCSLPYVKRELKGLGTTFWLMTTLHMLYLMVFHLFPNISGHFLTSRWGYNPIKAGFVSSLLTSFVVVGAPLTGLLIDRAGGQLYVCLAASILSSCAYLILAFTWVEPIIPILCLSLAESCVPVILMALIPMSVERGHFGFAFGFVEVFDALGSIVGNIIVGYVRDNSQNYNSCMSFFILLNVTCTLLLVSLILRDRRVDKVLNVAWYELALKQKGRGYLIEKGRQKRMVKVKRNRGTKATQRQ